MVVVAEGEIATMAGVVFWKKLGKRCARREDVRSWARQPCQSGGRIDDIEGPPQCTDQVLIQRTVERESLEAAAKSLMPLTNVLIPAKL